MATNQSSEWIDRYVNEVGRRLPAKQRDDVAREIRSLIEDEVNGQMEAQAEERGPAEARPADQEKTVLAVLQSFGPPAEIAARYHTPRTLIGPGLFPLYRLVLGIVLTITLFANLLGLAVAAGTQAGAPLLDTVLGLLGSLIQAVGMITLIFVILEYFGVGDDAKPEPWEAAKLPPVKDPNRISMIETVAEIAAAAVGLILLNGYLNRGTGALFFNGEWQATPLFSPQFLQLVPWLSVAWGADILVNIILLMRGRWEAATRLAAMLVAVGFAVLAYQALAGGSIAAWPSLDPAFKVTAVIIFAVSMWDAGKHGWLLLQASPLASRAMRSQTVA